MKLIQTLTITSVFTISTSPLVAQTKKENIDAKLITMTSSAGFDSDNQDIKDIMFFGSRPKIEFSFLIETNNIIQVLHETLTLQDSSKKWKCGPFPKISKSGNAALFTVEHQGDLLTSKKEINLQGSVDIKTGTKLITKDLALQKLEQEVTVDGFTFLAKKGELKVTGEHHNIQKISVTLGKKELKTNGSSSSNKQKTYYYSDINHGAKVSFSYWAGSETKKVTFSY